jgi:HK97 family phage major capsid protein
MAEAGLKIPANDASDSRSKPTMTPPELRRKIAEKKGEGQRLSKEWSKDWTEDFSADQLTKLDGMSNEIAVLERQLTAAERWQVADSHVSTAEERGMGLDDLPHNDRKNTRNGRLKYSVMKVMRHHMDPRKYPLDGIEAEVHDEMAKQRREQLLPSAKGVLIPWDLPVDLGSSMRWAERSSVGRSVTRRMLETRQQLRALDTTAGAGAIPTILDTTMIELLRPRMVTYKLGARVMTDMQGLFAIPRQSTASTFYMVAQGGSVTASNQTIDQVPFSPHTGGVYTTYTRQFLEQTNQDAEMFVREDQTAVVARGVETAAFNGQGSQGYPMGILQNTQIAVYALGTNGTAPTWAQLVDMEGYVAYFNADVGSLGYVCDALTRATLKQTLKISGSNFPIYLWNTEAREDPVNGYPCPVTNLLPQNLAKGSGTNLHAMIFGNWEDLVYAFWSGMDTIIDPYTAAAQGAVNIVTLQDFDVNVRHFYSFANCVDIVSSVSAPAI